MNCPLDNRRCYTRPSDSEGGVQVDVCRHGKIYRDGGLCKAQVKYGLTFEKLSINSSNNTQGEKKP